MALGGSTQNQTTPSRQRIEGLIVDSGRDRFWRERCFTLPIPADLSLWRRRLAALTKAIVPRSLMRKKTLVGVMEKVTDRLALGNRYGTKVWEVPFRDVYLVSAANGICDPELHGALGMDVAKYLEDSFRGFVDPREGIRVRCFGNANLGNNPGTASERIEVYVGASVHAPPLGERPVGWLRYYSDPADPGSAQEPRFPDGTLAAIYRGQHAIGFGIADPTSPVSLDVSVPGLAPGWVVVEGTMDAGRGLGIVARFPVSATNVYLQSGRPELADDDDVVDCRWDVVAFNVSGAQKAARLALCLDQRSSRLRPARKPSQGQEAKDELAITEIVVSPDDFASAPSKVWLEFDAESRLIYSSVQRRRYSLAWEFDRRRAVLFDWLSLRHLAASRFDVRVEETDGKARFRRRDDCPFGHVRPDRSKTFVTFAPTIDPTSAYELDWLDFSGSVQFATETLGLAGAYAPSGSPARTPLTAAGPPPGAETRIGPLCLRPLLPGGRHR